MLCEFSFLACKYSKCICYIQAEEGLDVQRVYDFLVDFHLDGEEGLIVRNSGGLAIVLPFEVLSEVQSFFLTLGPDLTGDGFFIAALEPVLLKEVMDVLPGVFGHGENSLNRFFDTHLF